MQNRGFTLIEMALVTMIIGILLVPLLTMYKVSVSGGAIEETRNSFKLSSEALTEFAGNNGRYPCPASLIIGPGEPHYGEPDCRDGNGFSGFTQPTMPGDCFAGICRTRGRDVDGDGVGDSILIGAVPHVVLNEGSLGNPPAVPVSIKNTDFLPASSTLDGWGRRLTYVVTEDMTNSATFNPYGGVISVVDENGLSVLEIPGTVHFILVSHGDDGAGGYNRDGMDVEDCHIGSADGDNCNQNLEGRFVSGLRSLDPGPDYYDDMVRYISFTASTIWENLGDTAIHNAPGGRVAIGKEDATARLDIEGNLQAVQIHTGQFCGQGGSATPGECYNPALIAAPVDQNPTMQCPSGQVMTGIANGRSICAAIPPVNVDASCPTGQVVVGISNLGNVRCCPVSPTGVLQCPN